MNLIDLLLSSVARLSSTTVWGLYFFMLTFSLAALCWFGIQVFRGPKHVHNRVARPLALVERAVQDALRELYRVEGAIPYSGSVNDANSQWAQLSSPMFFSPSKLRPQPVAPSFSKLFVNAFEQDALDLASISTAEIASMGKSAPQEYATLVRSIRSWNQHSGEEGSANALLPTILIADQAARNLSRLVEKKAWESAKRNAEERVLMSLIAPLQDDLVSPLGHQ